MKRYLEIELENGTKVLDTIQSLPQHWTEKRVQREFAEYLLLLALIGEETVTVGDGVEIPLTAIEDFHLVERGVK